MSRTSHAQQWLVHVYRSVLQRMRLREWLLQRGQLGLGRLTTTAKSAVVPPMVPEMDGLEVRLLMAAVSWDGGGDGVSWTNRYNWSGDIVPGSADDVTLAGTGSAITLSSGYQTINSLTTSRALTLSGSSSLTVNGASSIGGTLTIGSSTVTVKGGLFAGAEVSIGSNGCLTLQGSQTITGSGPITLTYSTGRLQVMGINSNTPATVTLASTMTLHGQGSVVSYYTGDTLASHGTITSDTAGTLALTSSVLTNSGTINATSGTLSLGGSWSNTGTISVSGGTLSMAGTFTTAGIGTITRTGGTVKLKGTLDNTGATLSLGSSTGVWGLDTGSVIHGGIIQATGGPWLQLLASAASTFESGVVLNADMTVLGSATLKTKGGLVVNGTLNASGSSSYISARDTQTFSGSGQVVLGSSATLEARGSDQLGVVLTLASGLTVTGQGTVGSVYTPDGIVNQGTLQGPASGTLTLSAQLDNQGTIIASGGTVAITSPSWTSRGTLRTTSGTMSLAGSWTNGSGVMETSGGTLILGGTFTTSGLGTFNYTGGTVKLRGTLDNTGATLCLGSSMGVWNLDNNSVIRGGTISAASGVWLQVLASQIATFQNGVVLNADMTIQNNATVKTTGGLEINGTLNASGSSSYISARDTQTFSGSGQIVLGSSATLEARGTSQLGVTLTVASGLTVTGQGSITSVYSGDRFVNQGTIQGPASGSMSVSALMDNQGTIVQPGGGSISISGTSWSSHGTLRVTSGTMYLSGAWQSSGVMDISGGTLSLGGTFSTSGLGTFNRTGGAVKLNGQLNNTGSTLALNSTTGTWTMESQSRITGGTITSSGGAALSVVGNYTTSYMDGVTLNGSVLVNPNTTLEILNGLTLNGTITLAGSTNSYATLLFKATQSLTGTGTVLTTGAYSMLRSGGVGTTSPQTLTIGSGVTVSGSGQVVRTYAGDTLVNYGTIRSGGDYGLTIAAGIVDNEGLVQASQGAIVISVDSFVNHGTVQSLGGALVRVQGKDLNGSTVALSGTEAKVRWNGMPGTTCEVASSQDGVTFEPFSTSSVSGNYEVVTGLNPDTPYTFNVTATDANGGKYVYTSTPVASLAQDDEMGMRSVSITDSVGSSFTLYAGPGYSWQANADAMNTGTERGALELELRGLVNDDSTPTSTSDGYQLYHSTSNGADIWTWNTELYPPPFSVPARVWNTFKAVVEAQAGVRMAHSSADSNNLSGNARRDFSDDPVRYFDGAVLYESADLVSQGLGQEFGQIRSWTNQGQFVTSTHNGTGMVQTKLPTLQQGSGGKIVSVVSGGTDVQQFKQSGGAYSSLSYLGDTLTHAGSEFTWTDTLGVRRTFYDFGAGVPAGRAGSLKSITDASGNTAVVTAWAADGSIAEVIRKDSAGVGWERWTYTPIAAGQANAGRLASVALARPDGLGGWQTVQQVAYSYYQSGDAHGGAGDLKTAVTQDADGTPISTTYYRYYRTGDTGGYAHGLKYVFEGPSYDRLVAAVGNPETAPDVLAAPFADQYFEYDSQRRVVTHAVQGAGASADGGLGVYHYAYSASANASGANSWKYKTVETLPDGNQNIVYCNSMGGVMLKVFRDVHDAANPALEGNEWCTFYKFDDEGRQILQAEPSAVTGYSELAADLLHSQNGNYQYLSDTTGLIHVTDYYTQTTAGASTPGGVAGYLQDQKLRQGELGADVWLGSQTYFAHTSSGASLYPVAEATVYANADGTGALTTSYSYTWYPSSLAMQSRTTTAPVVSAAHNGSGQSVSTVEWFDAWGELSWQKDAAGVLHYQAYDHGTGAVVRQITDVDTTLNGDFMGLPVGWSTPAGAGLHLMTTNEVDGLGRATKTTAPGGAVTYAVYDDPHHEVRTYAAWDAATGLPTGPTRVHREDWARGYGETLTMSAQPTLANGRPDGSEAIADLQSLARTYYNEGWQVIQSDSYADVESLPYGTAYHIGQEGVNYFATSYAYDAAGRQTSIRNAVGTITDTLFDSLGRPTAVYVGTDDSTTDGQAWRVSNAAAASNMVLTGTRQYDNGGVGDGLMTSSTAMPSGQTADNRVTRYLNDWRGRLVSTKQGTQVSEATDVNRPLEVRLLDNRGLLLSQSVYDGDALSMTDADHDGVPDALPSTDLRSRTQWAYDELGRAYSQTVDVIDQETGDAGEALTTLYWRDDRGQLTEQSNPGGTVIKNHYDSAGRTLASYVTDGNGDAAAGTAQAWLDAQSVADDHVYSQSEMSCDDDGNVLLAASRLRAEDAGAQQGPLGDMTSGVPARATYQASFYDAANRLVAQVNVGTNGGVAYVRPDGVPARSDATLVTSYTYDVAGWQDSTTDPLGIVSKQEHDALGHITLAVDNYTDGVVTADANRTVAYHYDGLGRVLEQTRLQSGDAPDQTARYVYGVDGPVHSNDLLARVEHTDPITGLASSSPTETFAYNRLGEQVSRTDLRGAENQVEYNVLGQVQAQTTVTTDGSGSPSTAFTYDTLGLQQSVTDPLGHTTTTIRDSLGRALRVMQADPDGNGPAGRPTTTYAYDAAGNVQTLTDPMGAQTQYEHDLLGRVTREQGPDPDAGGPLESAVTTYRYNVGGNRDLVTDPLGNVVGADPAMHTTATVYDDFGRTSQTIQPSPDGVAAAPVTHYGYDRLGHTTSITDPAGNTTTTIYDALGRATSQTNELGDSDVMVYDVVGNLTQRTDRDGRVVAYDYDALNRKTAERWLDGGGATIHTISFTYEADSRLASTSDSDSATSLIYDQLGRLHVMQTTYATQPLQAYVFTYGYDSADRMTSLVGTAGGVGYIDQLLGYDDAGRLTQITDQAGQRRVDFTYNALGQCLTLTRYSDTAGTTLVAASTYDYDQANRLQGLVHALGSLGTTTLTYAFAHDVADQITVLTTPDGVSQIGYDNDGQVTSASLTDEAYAYDANGNRTSGGSVNADDNRLSENATYTYQYDDEGNLTSRARKDGTETITFAWDYRNRLASAMAENGEGTLWQATYTYDPFDRRIARVVTGSQSVDEQYVYDGTDNAQAVLTADATGQLTGRILYGPQENQVLAEEALGDSTVKWALSDHLQSVRDVVDDSGAVLDHIVYDNFGGVQSQTDASAATRSLYTGAPQDSETGLIYLHRRYYDATTGRFVSQDPAGFAAGDDNLYRYVANAPLTASDPSGLCAQGGRLSSDEAQGILEFARYAMRSINWNSDPNSRTQQIVDCADVLRERGVSEEAIQLLLYDAIRQCTGQQMAISAWHAEDARDYSSLERLLGSCSILANTFTFGGTDAMGWTESGKYHGRVFVGAQIPATIARESAMTLATVFSGGLAQLGRGGLFVRGAYVSGRVYDAWNTGKSIGNAYVDLSNGDGLHAMLDAANGVLGVAGVRGYVSRPNVTSDMSLRRPTGALYGEERLAKLDAYLRRRNSGIASNSDQALSAAGANGQFIAWPNGQSKIVLRGNPSRYEVLHELSHYVDFRQRGFDAFKALENAKSEQTVYDLLRSERRWWTFSNEERAHATLYVFVAGGMPEP